MITDVQLNHFYRLKDHPQVEGVSIQIRSGGNLPERMVELEIITYDCPTGETRWYLARDLELSEGLS